MEIRRTVEIYDAFVDGDKYTNDEAIALRDAFKKAADALRPLGQRFEIAFKEVNINYLRLDDICSTRGLNEK